MKVVIAEDSYEGISSVGIYKDEKLVYQYDTYNSSPPDIEEILEKLDINAEVKAIDDNWFYKYADQTFPRILKDVKWKK